MRSFDEIVQLILTMQNTQSPVLSKMRDILQMYDGDWVLPMPDVAGEPTLPPLTPALVGEAVDSLAMRASSTRPVVSCPAINPTKETGVRSKETASTRRRIIAATYHESRWLLGRRRFDRQLSAYHTGSLVVVPDAQRELPIIEVRDPLGTFAEPLAAEQLRPPAYVAFIVRHSGEHLRAVYPATRAEAGGPITRYRTDEMWETFEWWDDEQVLYGLLGPVAGQGVHIATGSPWSSQRPSMALSPSFPNKAGRCPAIIPHNVSLGRIASRIGSLLGNVELQARLTALDILAQEKAIFPDTYVIGRQNAMPQIVGNQWLDGRSGDVNLLMDVESIGQLRSTPDLRTGQMIDRMERNFRVSTSLVPQVGGETYGALRTGRGIDALTGVAIDPRVQELHEIHEVYMPFINQIIFDTYKGYWGQRKFTLFSGWAGDTGLVEFIPDKDIETTHNTVSYAVPGADIIQLTQILGSLLGTGAISRQTFRHLHPYINDPESEAAAAETEQIDEALRQAVLQKLVGGELPLEVAVLIRKAMNEGEDIFTAVMTADRIIRERQATEAPPAPEGMVAPPEAMPGLAAATPQEMAQQPMPPEQQQVQSFGDVSRMRQLMQQMGAA